MAPELFDEEPFDGYAVDLWSAAVMLLAMLVGLDALFLLPSAQDKRYKEVCIECRLDEHIQKMGHPLSADATDLLQRMLASVPADRLTRAQVADHAWVKKHSVAAPSVMSHGTDSYQGKVAA